jgi:hypothetical protein
MANRIPASSADGFRSRVELQMALESPPTRVPDLRVADPAADVRWKDGSAVCGLDALPLCF